MVLYGYRFTHLRQIHTNSRVWLAEKLLEEPALTTCAVAEASQWTDAFAFRLLRCVPPHRWFWNPGMPQLSPSSSTESWKRFPLGGTSSPARKGKWKAWIVSLSHEAALAWYHACVEMWHLWTCGIHYVNDHAWKQIEQNIRLRYCDITKYSYLQVSIFISGNLWSPCLPLGVDDDHRLVTLTSNTLERPQLDISLHDGVRKLAANQTLGVENLKVARGEQNDGKNGKKTQQTSDSSSLEARVLQKRKNKTN